jgi:ABC-type uncharacterized transport system ATPase subunit
VRPHTGVRGHVLDGSGRRSFDCPVQESGCHVGQYILRALRVIDFAVAKGSFVGFCGLHGAGKTSLLPCAW